ncbi:MAG: hypothetical protein LLF98_13565 [Clostridium sp.]|uniref:hypothetical protein n=1 Tax=Clostridium sp. TaxID=1506 RepID=UPI0025BE82CA|nr:hypothetical protein [Clostridium sp.]MCE5222234.1 hypothetical protein [Clostridium sp.]
MNPDKKYMSQVNLDNADIKFVPLSVINKSFRDDVNTGHNLDLFPSEAGLPELCYYSNESEDSSSKNINTNINTAKYTIPTTFDILRSLDLDLDETEDLERVHSDNDVNKIYSIMEKRNPGILATLYSYRIPSAIVRVIVKRLIRLTLSYCNKENNY